jgi:hypothetical protein
VAWRVEAGTDAIDNKEKAAENNRNSAAATSDETTTTTTTTTEEFINAFLQPPTPRAFFPPPQKKKKKKKGKEKEEVVPRLPYVLLRRGRGYDVRRYPSATVAVSAVSVPAVSRTRSAGLACGSSGLRDSGGGGGSGGDGSSGGSSSVGSISHDREQPFRSVLEKSPTENNNAAAEAEVQKTSIRCALGDYLGGANNRNGVVVPFSPALLVVEEEGGVSSSMTISVPISLHNNDGGNSGCPPVPTHGELVQLGDLSSSRGGRSSNDDDDGNSGGSDSSSSEGWVVAVKRLPRSHRYDTAAAAGAGSSSSSDDTDGDAQCLFDLAFREAHVSLVAALKSDGLKPEEKGKEKGGLALCRATYAPTTKTPSSSVNTESALLQRPVSKEEASDGDGEKEEENVFSSWFLQDQEAGEEEEEVPPDEVWVPLSSHDWS